LSTVNNPSGAAMLNRLKARARALKREAYAVYLAARDPSTPWYAKLLIFFVVAHTFSPIDLIPDFVPVLGYLDDLIITPGGLWLAVRLIPPEVMAEARAAAASTNADKSVGRVGAALIVLLWIIGLAAIMYVVLHSTKRI
jgi:uncharacterized membrane protein YkvA (DUF1232 family)